MSCCEPLKVRSNYLNFFHFHLAPSCRPTIENLCNNEGQPSQPVHPMHLIKRIQHILERFHFVAIRPCRTMFVKKPINFHSRQIRQKRQWQRDIPYISHNRAVWCPNGSVGFLQYCTVVHYYCSTIHISTIKYERY